MAAGARVTVWVNATAPELNGQRFWTLIESTNNVPVLVERSMYWNADGQPWSAGTALAATPIVEK